MKKYLSFFRIRVLAGLQYRGPALAGVITQFVWGFMSIRLYHAFFLSDPASLPMQPQQLSNYIWLQQAFLAAFALWQMDSTIFQDIETGQVAYELTRPLDIYSMWFTKNLSLRVSRVLLRFLPILIIAFFLPGSGKLTIVSLYRCLLFILSMTLTMILMVAMAMLLYAGTFYTTNSMGLRIFAVSLAELLSGLAIPLPLMPQTIQNVLRFLPFNSLQNTPLLIYNGLTSGTNILFALLLQGFWIILFIVIGKKFIANGVKKAVILGG